MRNHDALGLLEQTLGAALVLFVLADVFLTVLYARAGSGILGYRLAALIWRLFRRVSSAAGPRRGVVLSFGGPSILLLVIAAWTLGLACGSAMIIHPKLGTSVASEGGPTPTDFVTALYAGGSSMSIVGSGGLSPRTGGFRLLFLLNSLIGMSVVSLLLTYLVQVYAALQRRNALALDFHFLSAGTGDAAELVARLGPRGRFDAGYSQLASLARGLAEAKEAHHFYPVLFYFRFREPFYSMSRTALLALDAVSLIRAALDDEHYAWLKESAAAEELWRASHALVTTLEDSFLPGGMPGPDGPPSGAEAERWRRRYAAGLARLRGAGIRTVVDEPAGAEAYASQRALWDRHVAALATFMAYGSEEVDPAGGRLAEFSPPRNPAPPAATIR